MARYPTLEDYEKRRNWTDGIARCDELLRKSPTDVQLLTTKLQLVYAAGNVAEQAEVILSHLVSLQPPVRDVREIIAIEDAVQEGQRLTYPRPHTTGPEVARLWDALARSTASASHKSDIISVRFSRAVTDDRREDAQQALIQLKALQPKNRVAYMAHAAFTQLLSSSNQDLQARLALGLAKKAISEKFADEDPALDARVPGQIFAIQEADKELETVKGTRLGESKQVYDVIRRQGDRLTNGEDKPVAAPKEQIISPLAQLDASQLLFAKLVSDNAGSEAVSAFATNAIALLNTAFKSTEGGSRRSIAESSFLAISALTRLYKQTSQQQYLLYAAHIAEMLLRSNPHVHEARLILVYLYMRLNLGSLAIRMFDSLNIKEVQYDTVGHALFTDIALVHPFVFGTGKKNTFDPFKSTLNALAMYSRYEDKLADTQADVLGHGQTGMIFDLQELRDTLHASLSRRIIVLQHRRIARLTGAKVSEAAVIHPKVTEVWRHSNDTRDFKATFDYGYNVEKALHAPQTTISVSAEIVMAIAADTAWSLSKGETPLVQDLENLPKLLESAKMELKEFSGNASAAYLTADITTQLLTMLLATHSKPASPALSETSSATLSSIPPLISTLNNLPLTTLTTSLDPLTIHLRDYFMYIDTLRSVLSTCTSLAKTHMDPALVSALHPAQTLARQAIGQLQKHAKEQQAHIKTAGVKEYMMTIPESGGARSEDVVETMKSLGAEELHFFCDEVAKSARAGWEGVGKITA